MADAWHGPTLTNETLDFGPLALIAPLLQRLDIAPIIDLHLPPDPQLAYSHGRVLGLLLAARLCQPTALINVPAWAQRTGADLLWDIPAESLNDDRLGRALDAFFRQRHSILTAVAEVPPAHITHGHGDDAKLIQVGVTSVVDELGAVPLLSQCLDGQSNGHT